MSAPSLSWRAYIDHLREVAQLLVADPESQFGKRQYTAPTLGRGREIIFSAGLCRGALVLTCSRFQGYLISLMQEFLETLDQSEVDVARLPLVLKAELCLRFPYPAN